MRFSFSTVHLHRIDIEDERFRISTPDAVDDLAAAIKRIGLLYPPVLFEKDPGVYLIVAGFRRVAACRRLGLSVVEARIMPADSPAADCLHIAIADNTFHRPLNLIEQSMAVSKLAAYYPDDIGLSRAAVNLGMTINPGLADKLKRIPLLSASLRRSILSESIPLSIALALDATASPLADRLVAIFDQLRPTLNQQKQMVEWVNDLARMEPAAADLLGDEACREILADADLDRPRKIRRLMDVLKRRRYPVMSSFTDQYRQRMQTLNLPRGMELAPPEDFETDRHRVILEFDSLAGLEAHVIGLHALINDVNFQALINKDVADQDPLH